MLIKNKQILHKTVGKGEKCITIAPGEGKVPSNIMRQEHFDIEAFPKHHPSGKYGLNYKRDHRLTKQMYFNQRLQNVDQRFSKDPSYLFTAAYYVERHAVESQINVSGLRGKSTLGDNGDVEITLNDAFDVFKKVKGSPKFWQVAKLELIARVKQLGPFHVFYTFSCGETRWAEAYLCCLKNQGLDIMIPEDWNGNENEILVVEDGKEGVPLWTYVNDVMSQPKHNLFADFMVLMTRMFDKRVKTFIQHILMGHGEDKISFEYYVYRVEFQARGMPHIHGVAWIAKWCLEKFGISDMYLNNAKDEAVAKLADELISCQLPDIPKVGKNLSNDELSKSKYDKKLRSIVSEVQQHKHTSSCTKRNGLCRYL